VEGESLTTAKTRRKRGKKTIRKYDFRKPVNTRDMVQNRNNEVYSDRVTKMTNFQVNPITWL
jgi:hypothetical protein